MLTCARSPQLVWAGIICYPRLEQHRDICRVAHPHKTQREPSGFQRRRFAPRSVNQVCPTRCCTTTVQWKPCLEGTAWFAFVATGLVESHRFNLQLLGKLLLAVGCRTGEATRCTDHGEYGALGHNSNDCLTVLGHVETHGRQSVSHCGGACGDSWQLFLHVRFFMLGTLQDCDVVQSFGLFILQFDTSGVLCR